MEAKNIRGTRPPPIRSAPPIKTVTPRVKNQFIKTHCGTAPIRKIHDCIGPTFSRGDNWHTSKLPKNSEATREDVHYSEQSSLVSLSTMTTTNYGNRLNMMATCDPIHGMKFVIKEFKLRLKAFYPDDDMFYQLISEVGHLVKRIEYGDTPPIPEETRIKRYVEKIVEKCGECENSIAVIKQLEGSLTCEKEQNNILTTRIADLETQISMKQCDNERLQENLRDQVDQVKQLQAAVTDKKLYDEAMLNKFEEYNKKLHEITQELFFSKLEVEKLSSKLKKKTEVIENMRRDLVQIQEINQELCELDIPSTNLQRKSSTNVSYKSDESFMKLLTIGIDGINADTPQEQPIKEKIN